MTDTDQEAVDAGPVIKSQWQLFRRRFFRHKPAIVSLVVLVVLYVLCFAAPLIAPFEKNEQDVLLGISGPSAEHWFGTDSIGRDYFTEVLYAGQISLKIGIGVAFISTFVGVVIGALAGFFGSWLDQLLMRTTDLFLIVPAIAILAVALQRFGTSDLTIILVLAAVFWMTIARVVRGQVLSLREKEYVDAARVAGAGSMRIIARHILPNSLGPIVVNATLSIGIAIIVESTLSFLGFGIQPPQTSWGRMLDNAKGNYEFNSHLLYFPALAVLITVLTINFIGDALRDALDPESVK